MKADQQSKDVCLALLLETIQFSLMKQEKKSLMLGLSRETKPIGDILKFLYKNILKVYLI